MTIYYMSTTGNNGNAGTIGSPWKTLSFSSAQLAAGDTLYIRGGTYTDKAFNFGPCVGTSGSRILVCAYPTGGVGPTHETVIFDGGGTASNFFNSGASNGASQFTTLQDLIVQNYGVLGGAASGSGMWFGWNVSTTPSRGNKVLSCTFEAIGSSNSQDHAIYFSHGCQSAEVAYCTFLQPAGAGIQTWHAPGIQTADFHDNQFFGGNWGVVMGDGASAVHIVNNLFVANDTGVHSAYKGEQDDGAYPASGTINLVVENNIFRACTNAIEFGEEHGSPIWSNNLFFGNTTIGKTGTSVVLSNPLWVNYVSDGSGDYHLLETSPAIAAATATYAPSLDFDGQPRPTPATVAYDIGPYQFITTVQAGPNSYVFGGKMRHLIRR